MCFKNLPIEFDVHGRAHLRDATWGEPFTPRTRAHVLEQLARGAHLRDFDIDPVTRVAGALSFHTVIDLERRQVVEARTEAPSFGVTSSSCKAVNRLMPSIFPAAPAACAAASTPPVRPWL